MHASNMIPKQVALNAATVMLAVIVALVLFIVFPLAPSYATQSSSEQEQVVKVGYYEARAFQEGAEDQAIKDGYGYEYLQRVAAYAGWRYEYVYGSWNELYAQLENSQIDVLAGVAKTDDRQNKVLFPNASMLNETYYLYENNSSVSDDDMDIGSVSRERVGVIANSNAAGALEQWIAENDIKPKVVSFKDKDSLARALQQGKIDAFVSSDNVSYDIKNIAPVQIIGKEPYYLAVAPTRHDLLESLNDAQTIISTQDRLFIDKLAAKYTVDTAANKYLTSDETIWMRQHDSLTVGYANNYLPYCDTDSSGNPTGLMIDVLHEILDKLPGDWQPELTYVSFDDQHDLYDALKNNEIDIAFPVGGETWYSEQKGYLRSSPVTSPTVDLIFLGSSNYATATQTIAVNTNNVLQQNYVRLHYPDAQIAYFDTIENCLKAVKSGKAGSTVVNGLRAGSLLNNQSNLVALQLPDNDDRCFGVNSSKSVLLQILNRGLGIIGSDFGTNASYLYMDGLYKYTVLDLALDYWPFIAAIVLALILFAIAWGVRHYNKLQREREREMLQNKILEEALEKAERASAAKDTLLGNLSHDIRTPLNGILGVIDVNMTIDDTEVRQVNARKAQAAAKQLLAVVDELLEMTKLKSGEVEVVLEPVCLGDVMGTCIEEKRVLAAQRNVSIEADECISSLEALCVMGSARYLHQVFASVIDNAIRYNRNGGDVRVSARVEPLEANRVKTHIEVVDTGIGMSAEHVDRIFEPFFQGQDSARSVYPGSGLGMPIANELVTLLGGTVDVQSEEGNGTKVTIELPFDLCDDSTASLGKDHDVQDGISGLKLLLAEDNELNVEITKFILEQNGAQVDIACNGADAVRSFADAPEGHYDGIIMDIMMPEMDGIEATKAIRSLDRQDAKVIPIIAMTANVFEEDKSDALEAGMNAHLSKPLDDEQLVSTLNRLCRPR